MNYAQISRWFLRKYTIDNEFVLLMFYHITKEKYKTSNTIQL